MKSHHYAVQPIPVRHQNGFHYQGLIITCSSCHKKIGETYYSDNELEEAVNNGLLHDNGSTDFCVLTNSEQLSSLLAAIL